MNMNIDVVYCLNSVLTNEYALFTKTLYYHWNITGPRFNPLHNFFGENYKEILLIMDEVAERVRVLEDRPATTEIKTAAYKNLSSEKMLENLAEDHGSVISQIKEILVDKKKFFNDPGSEDLFISTLRKHEIMHWKLRSHLQK